MRAGWHWAGALVAAAYLTGSAGAEGGAAEWTSRGEEWMLGAAVVQNTAGAGEAQEGIAMEPEAAMAARKPRRGWRWAKWAALGPVALAAGIGVYGDAARRSMVREVSVATRDPATGIVAGAEPIDLDPPAGSDRPTSAVLMLHGFVGSRGDFNGLGERLAARGFHVRMALAPGHGREPKEWSKPTPAEVLDHAREELAALKKDYATVDVVGFSMGGSVATILAAEGGVRRCVLLAPYYGVTHKWWYGLPTETWTAMLGPVVPYVKKSKYFVKVNREEAKDQIYSYHVVSTKGARTLMALGEEARRPETLAAVTCPVLMIISDGDDASSPRRAREAFAGLTNAPAQAVWLQRSNHHLLWDYEREEVMAEVEAFLAGGENRQ